MLLTLVNHFTEFERTFFFLKKSPSDYIDNNFKVLDRFPYSYINTYFKLNSSQYAKKTIDSKLLYGQESSGGKYTTRKIRTKFYLNFNLVPGPSP